MHETCEDIRRHLSFWAQQGIGHYKRFTAYENYGAGGSLDPEVLRGAWLQRESRTLEEMYSVAPCASVNPEINSVPTLTRRIEQLGLTRLINVRIAEEQEREVSHEA